MTILKCYVFFGEIRQRLSFSATNTPDGPDMKQAGKCGNVNVKNLLMPTVKQDVLGQFLF